MIYPECQGACKYRSGCEGELRCVTGITPDGGSMVVDPIYYCDGVIKKEEALGYTFIYHADKSVALDVDSKACTCDMNVLLISGCQCGGN